MSADTIAADPPSFRQRLRQKPLALSLAYVGIIVYASLYSNHAWRDTGIGLFDFLGGNWPRYWTWQDALFNVLAYLPLGFLLTLSPRHRRSPWARVLIPVLIGCLLSATMEALQTFIPGRVSSALDLLFNTLGTLCGATLSLFGGPSLLTSAGRLRQRLGVRRVSAETGLILLALWLFAQISPETLFFGLGDLRNLLALPPALPFSPDLHILLEMLIAALQTLVVALLLHGVLERLAFTRRQQFVAILILLALGVLIRTLASWVLLNNLPLFGEDARWAALTPGGIQGLALGLALLFPLLYLPASWQMPLVAMCLMTATVLVNLMPINPYSPMALTVWRQGHFLNFNGLTRLIAALWPYLTLLFLVWADRQALRDEALARRL
mgnify:FL=1